jgi:hypothetical protein
MQYRIVSAVAAPVLLAVTVLTRPPLLDAQSASTARPITVATRLETLSRGRAARWTAAAPVIRCAPAPLTERPGSAAELARPHVAPLEEAFLDAATVKQTFAVRLQPLNRPIR